MAEQARLVPAPAPAATAAPPSAVAAELRHESLEQRPQGEAERRHRDLIAGRSLKPQALDPSAGAPNRTGLPDRLKAGVESLSGLSMDDVKVHYDSASPARLQALAYAQGTEIHVASGQEQHLPHEARHVVQQKQGRVRPTKPLRGEARVNDDGGLEREADLMGSRAMAGGAQAGALAARPAAPGSQPVAQAVVQRVIAGPEYDKIVPFRAVQDSVILVEDGEEDRFTLTAIAPPNVTLKEKDGDETTVVTIVAFKADYTLVEVSQGGVTIPKDAFVNDAYTQERNNSQVIDLPNHPLGVTHYSFDLLYGDVHNQRDNDHLTVENSLALLVKRAKEGGNALENFAAEKPDLNKAQINTKLKNEGVSELDNFNFRPKTDRQVARNIGNTLDPDQALRNDNNPKQNASAAVAVDEELNLAQFMTFVGAALAKIGVSAPLIGQIRESVRHQAVDRMRFDLEDLFVNEGQVKDVTRFALILRGVMGLDWMQYEVPAPLEGFSKYPPYVEFYRDDFDSFKAKLAQAVDQNTFTAVNNAMQQDDHWKASAGQQNYAPVSEFLTTHYWPTIKGWILHPPQPG